MARWIVLALVCVGMWLNPRAATAWVGTTIQSSVTFVEIAETGSAKVTHEWTFRVRGGPLKSLTVDGVDADAQLLDDATVTRAVSGAVAGPPIPVSGERDGRSLYLAMGSGKGLPSGAYLLRFSYITDLETRGMIRSSGNMAELEWQSPTYAEGIDSLKVAFTLRRGAVPPRVAGATNERAQAADVVDVVATDKGVFLSELRREAETDTLSLIRPHVARLESVTWRIEIDPAVVGLARKPSEKSETPQGSLPRAQSPGFQSRPYAIATALALVFCALLAWKLRAKGTAPILRCRLSYRLLLTTLSMWWSVWCALVPEWPTVAALLLAVASLLALSRPELAMPGARGPGTWKTIKAVDIGVGERVVSGTRWLDVATLPGCIAFCGIVGSALLLSLRMIGVAPYYSAMALLYAMAFVPIFFSVGRTRHVDPVLEQFDFLKPLLKRVPRALADVSLIARYPDGSERPDEVRMVVSPKSVKAGLRSCEVAVEHSQGAFGRVMTPALLFRVEEHSQAHQALPRDGQWSRGRDNAERILVLRPSLPLRSVTLDLLRQTLAALAVPKPRQSLKSKGSKLRTSSGGALVQSKGLHPAAPR